MTLPELEKPPPPTRIEIVEKEIDMNLPGESKKLKRELMQLNKKSRNPKHSREHNVDEIKSKGN